MKMPLIAALGIVSITLTGIAPCRADTSGRRSTHMSINQAEDVVKNEHPGSSIVTTSLRDRDHKPMWEVRFKTPNGASQTLYFDYASGDMTASPK